MVDNWHADYLLNLYDNEIEEFVKENSDIEYDKDEVIDITSGLTGCEGCNSNSVWGFVRGMERAKDIIREKRL
jgi:hypothetical protein|tara:strand:+ start:328 stop:546 length:219 start_codon:yes stop_codon:yes gene_type:complete